MVMTMIVSKGDLYDPYNDQLPPSPTYQQGADMT
jgi:hypothetical protein